MRKLSQVGVVMVKFKMPTIEYKRLRGVVARGMVSAFIRDAIKQKLERVAKA